MSHEMEHEAPGGGILANKLLWLCIGVSVFILNGWPVGFWAGPGDFLYRSLSFASACQSWVHLSRPTPCVLS